MVTNGFYRIVYGGPAGSGIGVLAITDGKIVGVDGGGGVFDGTYSEDPAKGTVTFDLDVTVPPNMPLVTGERARPEAWKLPIHTTMRTNFASGMPVNIDTPYGAINVSFTLLRAM